MTMVSCAMSARSGPFCFQLFDGRERCVDRSTATDINNSKQIVGFSTTPSNGSTHAFVDGGGRLEDLGTLGGNSSWAYGINDSGQVVGGALTASGEFRPFLYDRGTMYDLSTSIVDPSGTPPFVAYAINNFGQIVGNHHVLNPVYDAVSPGRELSFGVTLGEKFRFDYWVARRNSTTACHAARNRLELQVRINSTPRPGLWLPAAILSRCAESKDWAAVSVTIPEDMRNMPAQIHIRVQASGIPQDALLYLRHFRIE